MGPELSDLFVRYKELKKHLKQMKAAAPPPTGAPDGACVAHAPKHAQLAPYITQNNFRTCPCHCMSAACALPCGTCAGDNAGGGAAAGAQQGSSSSAPRSNEGGAGTALSPEEIAFVNTLNEVRCPTAPCLFPRQRSATSQIWWEGVTPSPHTHTQHMWWRCTIAAASSLAPFPHC